MNAITALAVRRPAIWMWAAGLFSLLMIALVAAPSLAPRTFSFLQPLKVDTDPENMLAADEPVRVFHNEMKRLFGLNDLIVVGVVDPASPDGVFTVQTLGDVYQLTRFAETLRWTEDGKPHGVVGVDIIAPSTVDDIDQAGLGAVSFSWLMPEPPTSREEALAVRDKAEDIPTLNDTLVSGDGQALALYLPIFAKDDSYRVVQALKERIASFDGSADWHITGLPIAQDQFGVEMFIQMAISAPAAMLLIFALMWVFFRKLQLIVAPMIVAMVSVIGAMGLLIATGHTVHIMSSMIPIFVMPIAVLDAVHILSDFYDRYPALKDRRETLAHVMKELWTPMLFTTLTTCAGFLSLATTPIPPVRVFGIFVAIGVFLAWLLTVTLIPAYVMLMPERAFANFGLSKDGDNGPLARFLFAVGTFARVRARAVIAVFVVATAVAGYGISQIQINDNPVKWFAEDHEIRVADRVLNERFGGTYMAYLSLAAEPTAETVPEVATSLATVLETLGTPEAQTAADRLAELADGAETPDGLYEALINFALDRQAEAETDAAWDAWDQVALAVERVSQGGEVFKRPDMLRYIERLQDHLVETGRVGKSNALPDIVKTVHRELLLGDQKEFRIPDTPEAVAQTLITFQNSHRPQDLFKLVTPDFTRADVWLQLKSGDNVDMRAVMADVEDYLAANPPPVALEHDWFGLTYINVVWQQKMVGGMALALASGAAAVLVLMIILLRSFAWGLLSVVPLTVTIAFIYGVIGIIGKDYDMPIAVLSSLSIGLAVDYALHFIVRSRQIFARVGTWEKTAALAFGEPARAIFRNIIVIGVGFLPLLLAPLIPYQTVGIFISAILLTAGVATLLGLPALITVFKPYLFKERTEPCVDESLASQPH